uniref:ATP synthase F0 subunit a n=1 Tax=Crassiphycus birdiae TaxID=2782747 RepID=UPI001D118D72|nr:ATP synthase F0 subunit a [Crassiphycus birdiae]YP_010199655.1 ATP synthase F0 subunit a [Crassiphycus corneus]YP_010199680.1 ATP synthase F0 subunit a [Crassiphycus crassissimus]YP_010199880.1 ATP synthase F0 subunit a [Crassiphycus usneoides]UAD89413.1 ATP synthase F0 subunit a [Crassiphycus birdiae]UAD89563.1 ATP synthase F0 subunit a [Crassiphycus corneus]UAD89588.1 ATP synthase F0 subunit a [Crassiphycus crassissimus]UAD89888.1 ATP synthase F0 subunit a [Crassiphycus usneoides]
MLTSTLLASPLEQFEIVTLVPLTFFGLNISITNSVLFMLFAFLIAILWISLSFYENTVIPNNWQLLSELVYNVTSNIVQDNLGSKGESYFPFIFTLHLFLLFSNLIGMIPYSFTVTSHITFTFGLALSIFIGINIIGIQTHGVKFFALFLPRGVPLPIVPLLITIEFLSYIVKVFTLSIRLFANMTSGHTLLKIIAGFAWTMLSAGGLLAIFHLIPLGLLLALIGLELAIAGLQAYVFTLLTCIYLNDVLEFH